MTVKNQTGAATITTRVWRSRLLIYNGHRNWKHIRLQRHFFSSRSLSLQLSPVIQFLKFVILFSFFFLFHDTDSSVFNNGEKTAYFMNMYSLIYSFMQPLSFCRSYRQFVPPTALIPESYKTTLETHNVRQAYQISQQLVDVSKMYRRPFFYYFIFPPEVGEPSNPP